MQQSACAYLWKKISCLKLRKIGIAFHAGAHCTANYMVEGMLAIMGPKACIAKSHLLLALPQCKKSWSHGICTEHEVTSNSNNTTNKTSEQ